MKSKTKIFLTSLLLVGFLCFATSAFGRFADVTKPNVNPTDGRYLTVNSVKMPLQNDAIFGQNPYTGRAGTEWPQGSSNFYIYGAGVWIGAQIPDGGGGYKKVVSMGYNPNDGYSEWGPGEVSAPYQSADHSDPVYKVYLSTDIGLALGIEDWPVKDSLGNPLILSKEDSWCVYNDADITYHDAFASPGDQLNIEVEQTTYSFNTKYDKNIIFVVWELTNKGDRDLDSVYVGITCDPDLGNATDDMIGFDPDKNLAWVYNYNPNFDQDITGIPGMMGFRFFESPKDGQGNQLGLTSLTLFTIDTDPANDEQRYNIMAGLTTSGNPRPDGPFDTDTSPQDKRFCQGTGPFTLKVEQTERVVFGVVAGENEIILKSNSDYAQTLYDAAFSAPTAPDPPVVRSFGGDGEVILTWSSEPERSLEKFALADTSLRLYDFEGYRIYKSKTGIESDFVAIAEFDLANGITDDTEDDIDPQYGIPITVPVHLGNDSGIKYYYVDKDVLNGETYYYAVVAYDYQPKRPKSLESGKLEKNSFVEVVPHAYAAGYVPSQADSTADHTSSGVTSDGWVTVEVIDPSAVIGDDYQVTFNSDSSWNLINSNTNQTLLSNQTNQSGDQWYKVTEGLLVKVVNPPWDKKSAEQTEFATPGVTTLNMGYWYGAMGDVFGFPLGVEKHYRTDFEIRFTGTGSEAYSFADDISPIQVPFEIWNITDGYQVIAEIYDRGDLTWDVKNKDYIDIVNFPYDGNPHPEAFPYDHVWFFRFGADDTNYASGDVFRITAYKPNTQDDVFTFSTVKGSVESGKAKAELADVKVVPNPYFIRNELDRDPNVSHLIFTNLPDECTIRIYTLVGNLIQTIHHDDGTGQQIWNVLTYNDQIPASGVYIFHIDSKYGQKIGKFAILR